MWSAILKKASRSGLTSASCAVSCQLTTSSSSQGDAARSLIAMRTPPPSGHASIAAEHLSPLPGPRLYRSGAPVGAPGAIAPVAHGDRELNARLGVAVEVVEDVGPVDGDRV